MGVVPGSFECWPWMKPPLQGVYPQSPSPIASTATAVPITPPAGAGVTQLPAFVLQHEQLSCQAKGFCAARKLCVGSPPVARLTAMSGGASSTRLLPTP
jgi:hypothetical protein